MVEVVEAYRDYAPPPEWSSVLEDVDDVLRSVKPELIAGLRTVVLTNGAALTGARKRRWSWHRGKKSPHTHALGMYHQESRGDGAWIELFVDRMIVDWATPAWAVRLRVARVCVIGSTLLHEVGHHIHRRHRPESGDPEDIADRWGNRLLFAHLRRRHKVVFLMLTTLFRLERLFQRRRPSRERRPARGGASGG